MSRADVEKGVRAGLEAAANAIPHTWLDPLLSGPDNVGSFTTAIEPLLTEVSDRIRALADGLKE